jgi:DNA-damage-inducible protein J
MASSLVQIRVDEDLKNQATDIFEKLGLDLPTAFRMFLKKSVEANGIPFSVKIEKEKTSLKSGRKSFFALRREARKNKLQDKNLDEINETIRECRTE